MVERALKDAAVVGTAPEHRARLDWVEDWPVALLILLLVLGADLVVVLVADCLVFLGGSGWSY